jgi:predicted XRE-type DNA-binding protein
MKNSKIYDPKAVRKRLSTHPDYEKFSAENADEMMLEGLTFWFNMYRRRRRITQKKIAEELLISQPAVCQMLKRPATIGTLWRLCEAMDARLEITIQFKDEEPKSLIFGDDPVHPDEAWMMEPDATVPEHK